MRYLAIFAALSLAAAEKPIELPENVRQAVDLARSTAPELAADSLIRLVESGRVPSPEAQSELLEDAFRTAARAQQPAPLRGAGAAVPQPLSVYQAKAFSLGYDTLSLRARALSALLRVDVKKARQLFPQFGRPTAVSTCADDLVADLAPWYRAAGDYLQMALTAKEREAEEPVRFILGVVSALQSAPELEAVHYLLERVQLGPSQQSLIAAAYAARLDSIAVDDRSFSATLEQVAFTVASMASANPGGPIDELRRGVRSYLVHHLSGKRCAGGGKFEMAAGQTLNWFNSTFRAQIPAIPEEALTAKRDNLPTGSSDADNNGLAERTALAASMMDLLYAGGTLRPESERSGAQWRHQVDDVFEAMARWRVESLRGFHEKSLLYRSLANSLPAGEDRSRAQREHVLFLATEETQEKSFADWMYQVLENRNNAPDRQAMRSLWMGSGNIAMMVQAMVEDLTGTGAAQAAVSR